MAAARHILVLVDRDRTHPQAGGTGTVMRSQVVRRLDAGHRVTVVAGPTTPPSRCRGRTSASRSTAWARA